MIPIKKYNKRNWYTEVVHESNPIWSSWEEIPEHLRNPLAPQHRFHRTLCGADKLGGRGFNKFENPITGVYKSERHMETFCLTSVREVTCNRCLKILEKG